MNYETLRLTTPKPGILEITLARPEIRNAFNAKMIEELSSIFDPKTGVVLQESVRAVVLKGDGQAFCAGGDLNWMRQSIQLTYEGNLKDTTTLTQMFQKMNECPKPLVGVVQGAAIGGGVGLVAVCDIVYAEAETVFSLSEVRLGVVPACIGPFVTSKIGGSHARSLFISAERFKAKKAKEVGLIHEVFETRADLDQALDKLTDNLLECGPMAMSVAKDLVLNLTWPEKRKEIPDCIHYVSKTLAELRVKPEAQEGVTAFLEKRKPKWITSR